MKNKQLYTVGSDNIFADLGLPNADELLVKASLMVTIKNIIKHKKLTQVKAAKILGIDQPKISALLSGQFSGFSVERLMRFLLLLGRDVEIVVKTMPRSRTQARLKVA